MHKLSLAALLLGALYTPASAQDPETKQALDQLRQRVDEIEEQQAKTADRVGGRALLQAYSARTVDLGGHVSSLFTSMAGERSTATGHLVTLLELYVRAELDDHWSLFATPGFYTFNGGLVDDPVTASITGDPIFLESETALADLFLARAYGQFVAGDELQVQAGVVGSPHGNANREYFIPSRVIAQANLHTRYFLGNQVYPQQVLGARVLGKLALAGGNDRLEYDAYFGAEDDSPGDGIGGARLAYVFADLGLTVAANYGRGTREGFPPQPLTSPFPLFTSNVPLLQAPFRVRYNLTRDYELGGVDVEWRSGPLIARTEAYYSAESDVEDQRVFSQEVNWFFLDDLAASYRFDYHDAGADLDPFGIAVGSLGHATEHVVGLCYSPSAGVRLRLDFHHLDRKSVV